MIFDRPDETITVKGKEYKIETDFKIWLEFTIKISDANEDKVIYEITFLLRKMNIPVCQESLDALVAFYEHGAASEKKSKENAKNSNGSHEKIIDFKKDESLIFSAFLSQYSINLQTDSLHWWNFMSLFRGLNEEHLISKMMSYRALDLSKVPKESREHYRKLKEAYAIDQKPVYKTLAERDAAFLAKIKRKQQEVNNNSK